MIIIKTSKHVDESGKLYRKIKKINMLSQEDLPQEYLSWEKNVRIDDDVLIVRGFFTTSWGAYRMFTIGLRIPEEIFQALIIHIRECGNILQHININKKKEWEGNETIKI